MLMIVNATCVTDLNVLSVSSVGLVLVVVVSLVASISGRKFFDITKHLRVHHEVLLLRVVWVCSCCCCVYRALKWIVFVYQCAVASELFTSGPKFPLNLSIFCALFVFAAEDNVVSVLC